MEVFEIQSAVLCVEGETQGWKMQCALSPRSQLGSPGLPTGVDGGSWLIGVPGGGLVSGRDRASSILGLVGFVWCKHLCFFIVYN